MSKKSYQIMQPEAWEIIQHRIKESEHRSMKIMSRGIQLVSSLLFVFGVCIGNLEFMVMSMAFAAAGCIIGREV